MNTEAIPVGMISALVGMTVCRYVDDMAFLPLSVRNAIMAAMGSLVPLSAAMSTVLTVWMLIHTERQWIPAGALTVMLTFMAGGMPLIIEPTIDLDRRFRERLHRWWGFGAFLLMFVQIIIYICATIRL